MIMVRICFSGPVTMTFVFWEKSKFVIVRITERNHSFESGPYRGVPISKPYNPPGRLSRAPTTACRSYRRRQLIRNNAITRCVGDWRGGGSQTVEVLGWATPGGSRRQRRRSSLAGL